MEYRYTAVMLGKREVGETDRFYTFYTREQGKVTALARGVRKSEAKLGSALETATLSEIMVARTRGVGKITGAVLEESYPKLHTSSTALSATLRFLRLVDETIEPNEPDSTIFSLIQSLLVEMERLVKQEARGEISTFFSEAAQWKLCFLLGYHLELFHSVITGKRLPSGSPLFMSFASGGILIGDEVREAHDAILLSENAIKTLRLIAQCTFSQLERIIYQPETIKEIMKLRQAFVVWIRR